MSTKIEAGKVWMIEKQGDYSVEKSGILLPGGLILSSPAYLNGHSKQVIKLYSSWNRVEVWSGLVHSTVSGHLPGEVDTLGQVLYSSVSPKYGKSIFTLIGFGAEVRWEEVGSDDYLRIENQVDIGGKVISKTQEEL